MLLHPFSPHGNGLRQRPTTPGSPGRLKFRNARLGPFAPLAATALTAVSLVLYCAAGAAAADTSFLSKALHKAPPAVLDALDAGKPQDLLVLFDDAPVEAEARSRKVRGKLPHDDAPLLAYRAASYRALKERALSGLSRAETEVVREYSHLPMHFQHFRSRRALERLLDRPEVLAVFQDRPIYQALDQSLPLIRQPAVAALSLGGTGTSVAVIDTGIDYTLPHFGSCSSPGVPAGCRVAASVDLTGNGLTLNTAPNNHGTNVAGIVAGVAPQAAIAAVNVFSGGASSTALVIDGINWAIANKDAYAIAALNMSLGDGVRYSSPCRNLIGNPFVTAINNARSAGLLPVAASGNNGYTDGISAPACTPGVVSVGAVYDSNVGGISWSTGACTDYTTAADRILCSSNSADFLTMLAPGALIASAGGSKGGTSQAAPHVAGAAAVLRSAFPAETLEETVARMADGGVPLTDPRNAITTPRLNLLAALGAPANDSFAAAERLDGGSGQRATHNANASREEGEPLHAGQAGGRSIWWRWTAPAAGFAAMDTLGSNFDTLLAVYTGDSVDTLVQVAANDNVGAGNSSALTFTAHPGAEYRIAVDGNAAASGALTLNWQVTPQSDLAASVSASPAAPVAGENITYSVTVDNHGPSTATEVALVAPLPTPASFFSASAGCSHSAGTLTCALGTLPSGAVAVVEILITAQQPGEFPTTVSVSSPVSDPASDNNTAAVSVPVGAAAAPAVPALSPWSLFAAAGVMLIAVARRTTGSEKSTSGR